MGAFVVGIASAWSRGLAIDCGCFGGGGEVAPADTDYLVTIARDLGFALLAAYLVWRPVTALSLDPVPPTAGAREPDPPTDAVDTAHAEHGQAPRTAQPNRGG